MKAFACLFLLCLVVIAFPIFRVGYADHSSWDMVWLRIDYNGRGGFDAFVTDINLARVRVSYVMPSFPKANQWVHLTLSWDETRGISRRRRT
jgi:hypothetical protein